MILMATFGLNGKRIEILSRRFINYCSFPRKREKLSKRDITWLEKTDKTTIGFKVKGLTQKKVDKFWKDFAKQVNSEFITF
jgi:hypothetical protein